MAGELGGCVVGCLIGNGVPGELVGQLRTLLRERGARVHLICMAPGHVRTREGTEIEGDTEVSEVSPGYYDGLLVLPEAAASDLESEDEEPIAFLQISSERRQPIGGIGNGVALIADAGIIAGCQIACDLEIAEDVRAAEGQPVEDSIAVDRFLVTGRSDCDLDTFCDRFADVVRSRRQELSEIDERSRESFPASDAHSGAIAG